MDVSKCLRNWLTVIYIFYLCEILIISGKSLRNRRHKTHHKAPCKSSRIDIETESGVKIESLNASKVYIDAFDGPFDDSNMLKFEFKTTSSNATLFYMTRRNDDYDMVSGALSDGYFQFKIRCKFTTYADLTIPGIRVDDGTWHKVKFQRRNRKGVFTLDKVPFFEQYYVGCGGFTSINFGSINREHESSQSVQELMSHNGEMDGCVRKLYMSNGIKASPHYTAVSECH